MALCIILLDVERLLTLYYLLSRVYLGSNNSWRHPGPIRVFHALIAGAQLCFPQMFHAVLSALEGTCRQHLIWTGPRPIL